MTQDEWPHTWRARVIELSKLLGAGTSIAATMMATWLFVWGPVGEFVGLIRGIPGELTRMWEAIEQLESSVATATGEDRIIREQPGQTYVPEPVYLGDRVQFNMVVERTRLGLPCTLLRTIPIFTDETRIAQPGPPVIPLRQVEATATPVQPRYQMPASLRPGRVAMYLILVYECPTGEANVMQEVRDRTSIAVFRLLEGPRPE
jgi:hypothetical protein